MANKTKKAETKTTGPRWRIGLFRNDKGKLVTVYVSPDGSPVPYEQKRVGDREILYHGEYTGMPYRDARQVLLKEAAEKGLENAKVDANALPEDFPGASALKAAGITTFAGLEAVEDLTSIKGVGKKTVEAITEALEAR